MPTARPFSYNTGSTITGTEQVGQLAIGTPTDGFESTGLKWWNGPDEDLGYVIAHTTPSGNQPNQFSIPAYLGFWRTDTKTDQSFINLAEYVSVQHNVSGAVQLATFNDGVNCLAAKTVGSSTLVSVNAWPAEINSNNSTICKMFGNSILYAAGVI